MKTKFAPIRLLTAGCMGALLLTGCGSDSKNNSTQAPALSPAKATLYHNANIYTANTKQPEASSMLIADGKILATGSEAEIRSQLASSTQLTSVDLQGRFVMPGIIDAHTHPGLVSVLGTPADETDDGEEEAFLPTSSKDAFFAGLRQLAVATKDENFVFAGEWSVNMFLPEGPHKRDLDAIFGAKPVILSDDSGHSFWLNSAALAFMKIDKNTPDMSKDVSYFVKDKDSELTGWVKEFAIVPHLSNLLVPPADVFKKRISAFLKMLSASGVTSLWDGGNYEMHNTVYGTLKAMDDAGELPLRYYGSYHIYRPGQLDTAIAEFKKMKQKYQGNMLKFETIKIHYDGVAEIGTAKVKGGYLDPKIGGSTGDGGLLFTAEQLSKLIQDLNKEDIDLHLHAVGDAATSEVIKAVKMAKAATAVNIEITLSHLETVDHNEIDQFNVLNLHANFTPQWLSGADAAVITNLGKARLDKDYMLMNSFFNKGANVTFSSDVINQGEIDRSNPFIGMQMGITRQEATEGSDIEITEPKAERINRSQMLLGYTINGAKQLGHESWLGSLQTGKTADFIVLDNNPTTVDAYKIKDIKPTAVVVNGKLVNGRL